MPHRKNARPLSVVVGVTTLMAAMWPASAAADDATLTVDPATVEAPGEYSFTVEGEGWTPSTVYILICDMPSSGLADDVDNATCDTSTAQPVAPHDGSFSVVLTFDVPADGLAIGAGDPGQTQSASAIVLVGAVPTLLAETGGLSLSIALIATALVALGWSLRRLSVGQGGFNSTTP